MVPEARNLLLMEKAPALSVISRAEGLRETVTPPSSFPGVMSRSKFPKLARSEIREIVHCVFFAVIFLAQARFLDAWRTIAS